MKNRRFLAVACLALLMVQQTFGQLTLVFLYQNHVVAAVNSTVPFTAAGIFPGEPHRSLNFITNVTWASSDASVATIDTNGIATAVGLGVTTISATVGPLTTNTTLTVVPSDSSLLVLTVIPANLTLTGSHAQPYTATGIFNNGTTSVVNNATWASTIDEVATIDSGSGLASPVGPGRTVISATSGNVIGSTLLTVFTKLVSFEVSPDGAVICTNRHEKFFNATGYYSDNTTADVTLLARWLSSDTSIAKVGVGGVVTTTDTTGTCQITAQIGQRKVITNLTVRNCKAQPAPWHYFYTFLAAVILGALVTKIFFQPRQRPPGR